MASHRHQRVNYSLQNTIPHHYGVLISICFLILNLATVLRVLFVPRIKFGRVGDSTGDIFISEKLKGWNRKRLKSLLRICKA